MCGNGPCDLVMPPHTNIHTQSRSCYEYIATRTNSEDPIIPSSPIVLPYKFPQNSVETMNLSFRPCSVLLLSLLKVATSQDLLWSFTSGDAEERRAASGVIEHGGFVYVAMNEDYNQEAGGTYNESYLYQLTLGGEIVKRVPVGTDRDKVGMISKHGADGVVVAPYTVDGNYSGGLRRFSVPDLTLDWAVPEISIGERGCPPLVSSTGTIVTGYGGGQLAATSATGELLWLVGIRVAGCPILSSDESAVYITEDTLEDDNSGTQNPVVAFNMENGVESSRTVAPDLIGSSLAGPALSPDGASVYQFRSNGGLARMSAADVTALTVVPGGEDAGVSARYNPIISSDGSVCYGGGYIGSPFVAMDLASVAPNATLLWESETTDLDLPVVLMDSDVAESQLIIYDSDQGSLEWRDARTGTVLAKHDGFNGGFGYQLSMNGGANRLHLAVEGDVHSYSMGSGTVSPAPTFALPTAAPTVSPTDPLPTNPPTPSGAIIAKEISFMHAVGITIAVFAGIVV